MNTDDTFMLPVEVDGMMILVTATARGGETATGGEEEIAGGRIPSFSGIGNAISKVAKELASAIESAKPSKATLEFGCDFAVEAGQLTALVVNGSGGASVKVTLEWTAGK